MKIKAHLPIDSIAMADELDNVEIKDNRIIIWPSKLEQVKEYIILLEDGKLRIRNPYTSMTLTVKEDKGDLIIDAI